MKYDTADAQFAITLAPREVNDLEHLAARYYQWTGWKRHHWPADVIHPGLRLYGFDKKSRQFCVVLEVTKGGSFTYRTRAEFGDQVRKMTGWTPNQDDPHWSKIPISRSGKHCTGIALRWRVIKRVNISWPHRFPRLGWERLEPNVDSNLVQDLNELGRSSPRLTETVRRRLVDSRLGQGEFRATLLSYWKGCAVTGCKAFDLLRASHIKPWRESNNHERLDPFNGFPLLPNLDIAFDLGLISFRDDGAILVASELDKETQRVLGINSGMGIKRLVAQHRKYLRFHREKVFRGS